MPSGLKTRTPNRMRHTRISNYESPRQEGHGRNRHVRIGNHLFQHESRMHTTLILNGMRMSMLNKRPLWRDTLYGVLQRRAEFIDSGWHVPHWYWETPRIGMTFQDNGTMNGLSILRWILQFSHGREAHFHQHLTTNRRSISSLTKTKHQMRRFCTYRKVSKAPSLIHFLLKGRSFFVLCQGKFVI
jgi:hypothetical protein